MTYNSKTIRKYTYNTLETKIIIKVKKKLINKKLYKYYKIKIFFLK